MKTDSGTVGRSDFSNKSPNSNQSSETLSGPSSEVLASSHTLSPPETHVGQASRHAVESSLLSATDETKRAVAELAASTSVGVDGSFCAESTNRPVAGILLNKPAKMRTNFGFVVSWTTCSLTLHIY